MKGIERLVTDPDRDPAVEALEPQREDGLTQTVSIELRRR